MVGDKGGSVIRGHVGMVTRGEAGLKGGQHRETGINAAVHRVGRPLPWPPFSYARASSRVRSPTCPISVRPRT